ncbi:MAG: TetR family transcriptional regulator, partial [Paracoccus sp. (in: a-proteobacteria)]|nr:TetR family transcriptional regulator [Paracoccus sp. (in: a-proteobacteria)]
RTTMGDIAAAAGIARPTLYLSFPQKQDIYGAVIDMLVQQTLERLDRALTDIPDPADRLSHACLTWGLEGFDLVRANPDAKDLFDLSYEPVRRGHALFRQMLSDLLAGGGCAEPDRNARMLSAAIKGIKAVAADRDEVRDMIVTLCDAVARRG